MVEIKRSDAKIKEGVRSNPLGDMGILRFPRHGVVMGAKEAIKVKRPNQRKKKKTTPKKKAKK